MKKTITTLCLLATIVAAVFLFNNRPASYTSEEMKQYFYELKKQRRHDGYAKMDKPDKYHDYFYAITHEISGKGEGYAPGDAVKEYNNAQKTVKKSGSSENAFLFTSHGPFNVGGRTRAIAVDPADATGKTWFAGAASGGIWKTTDEGFSWINISPSIPNLSVSTLVIAPSNTSVIYAGTGEGFASNISFVRGNGVLKSVDKGATWQTTESTFAHADWTFVNRIIVNPNDANHAVAVTNAGIFVTTDGFGTWTKTYTAKLAVQDLKFKPGNFNIQYAAETNTGILKSTDAGQTWAMVSNNQIIKPERIELAVSDADPKRVYASVEGAPTSLYVSKDEGLTWSLFKIPDYATFEDNIWDFLGGQGWYDNAIAVSPFDANVIFIGGVGVGKYTLNGQSENVETITSIDTVNTGSFLAFVNFGGKYLKGGMGEGPDENATDLIPGDMLPIEIRFGTGKTQKAHRFTVPAGATSGVPAANYAYQNYVDIPFEVWDIKNDRQLMVSFRDQERDGKFNLNMRDADELMPNNREYFYIHAIPYNSTTPIANITKNAGHLYKMMYFFWPTLAGGIWNDAKLPTATLTINRGYVTRLMGEMAIVADPYASYVTNGKNTNLHPDHHILIPFITDAANKKYKLINGNDGGITISINEGGTWIERFQGYITTQFYGADKKPKANEFVGGTQDNGTWQSQPGQDFKDKTFYSMKIGGDGFEVIWNYRDPNKIIGAYQYNGINRTINGGISWGPAKTGMAEDGPFISRLAGSMVTSPDRIFAIGTQGVYRSTNFGGSWSRVPISATKWAPGGISSQHNIEVSVFDDRVVWAGAANAETVNMFVSIDGGLKFNPIPKYTNFDMNYYITSIATHPTRANTAFMLYGIKGKPKVLKTEDLGQTWTDLSQMNPETGKSANGFPDVIAHSLLVLPSDTNTIWVGTEIGLFESNDYGTSWHIVPEMPAVSIWQLKAVDDKVVIATHGRGIWTATIPEMLHTPIAHNVMNESGNVKYEGSINTNVDSIEIYFNGKVAKTIKTVTAGVISESISVDKRAVYNIYMVAYKNKKGIKSAMVSIEAWPTGKQDLNINTVKIYPNPAKDYVTFSGEQFENKPYTLEIITLNGAVVYKQSGKGSTENTISLPNLLPGYYVFAVQANGLRYSRRLYIAQ